METETRCHRCNSRRPDRTPRPGLVTCDNCMERGYAKEKARRAAQPCVTCKTRPRAVGRLCTECNERKERRTHKAAPRPGMCSRCNQRAPSDGYNTCDACRAWSRERWARRPPEERTAFVERHRLWRAANPEKAQAQSRRKHQRLREAMFVHYGRICTCCGEAHPEFLTFDHINNDGARHRAELFPEGQRGGGTRFYLHMLKQGFPPGLQTLCWNCNCAKAHYGVCPHVTERALEVA